MSTSLPDHPDLDQLRRRAKELRDAARGGDPAAAERIRRYHPSASAGQVSLAAAQLVIARELGFSSWPTLKARVDAASAGGRRPRAPVGGRLDRGTAAPGGRTPTR